MRTTLELAQANKIHELEYKLSCLTGPIKLSFLDENIDLNEIIDTPTIRLPLYANMSVKLDKIKLSVTTSSVDGFNLYTEAYIQEPKDVFTLASAYDKLINRVQNEFIRSIQNKEG